MKKTNKLTFILLLGQLACVDESKGRLSLNRLKGDPVSLARGCTEQPEQHRMYQ